MKQQSSNKTSSMISRSYSNSSSNNNNNNNNNNSRQQHQPYRSNYNSKSQQQHQSAYHYPSSTTGSNSSTIKVKLQILLQITIWIIIPSIFVINLFLSYSHLSLSTSPSSLNASSQQKQQEESYNNDRIQHKQSINLQTYLTSTNQRIRTRKSKSTWWQTISSNYDFNNTESSQVVKTDKDGNIVHRSISSIQASDILPQLLSSSSDRTTASQNNNKMLTMDEALQDDLRTPILELLQDAGVQTIDETVLNQLPLWDDIKSLYYYNNDASTSNRRHAGNVFVDSEHIRDDNNDDNDDDDDGPIIYGLETCEQFRTTIPRDDASIGVAGLFNTGTNPLAMYLSANCKMPNNSHDKSGHNGIRWQVPWGKHMIANRKWSNTAKHDTKVNKTNVLPIVLIRDPYTWMQSMCQHPYAATWVYTKEHCPNLINTDMEQQQESPVYVTIPYPNNNYNDSSSKNDNHEPVQWLSLVHLWSDWYNQYMQADYPRLIVRFEDLIFHPKQLIAEICECAGAVPIDPDKFKYVVDAGKWGGPHTQSSNLISAMIKYGNDINRYKSMTKSDLLFAQNYIDHDLFRLFRYKPQPNRADSDHFVSKQDSYMQQMNVQPI